jgi:hypothetical protein
MLRAALLAIVMMEFELYPRFMRWKLGSISMIEPWRGGAHRKVIRSLGVLPLRGNKLILISLYLVLIRVGCYTVRPSPALVLFFIIISLSIFLCLHLVKGVPNRTNENWNYAL